ncbi:unnamed protein product [Brachionus calyciflorus]|uniref:ACB domain-containing protein n=1 Tax=Brachionus calyciflorus TaxID=104777 RepID=A0A813U3Y1_9BILA|nr:unnamed protein product [Brachionus calyciflorus]
MSNLNIEFEEAKILVNKLRNEPDNDTKLKLYAFFKQANVGKCNTPKPGMLDIVARSKWNAWNDLKKMSQDDAKKSYIEFVNKLYSEENPLEKKNPIKEKEKFTDILTSIEFDSIYKIILNRPNKLNALSRNMYSEIAMALKEAEENPKIKICVFTGAGDYFSSGNDLSNYTVQNEDPRDAIKKGCDLVENFINSFINFSKPLVALVNGPAIGICFTVLGLFDLVYCSDKATFYAPFTRSALSPEGCSSYTFPRLMGHLKACEILLFNKKLNAEEALARNLVNEIFPHKEMNILFNKKIEEFSRLNFAVRSLKI